MIPQSFIQELLQRVDVVDVVERYVKLKRAGANYAACCPFHSEKTPSFTVSPTKQFYHCFGCGAHGTAIGFLMDYAGLGFVEAVRELAQRVGMQVPEVRGEAATGGGRSAESLYGVLLTAARFYRAQLKNAPHAIAYLKQRGVSGEIAKRYGIGYAPDAWQALAAAFPDYGAKALIAAGLVKQNEEGKRYDVFRDRIMFPIVDVRGNVIGFGGRVMASEAGGPKYLNSPETAVFEKGRELYGAYQARRSIREAGRIVVVEGYMDVVALAQHGVGFAVATLGTATTPMHVQKLLRQADEIVFCFDGDDAGRRAAWRALENGLAHVQDGKRLSFLFLPQGEDPDTYVREHGKDGFEVLLDRALPLSRYFLEALTRGVDLASAEGRAGLVHAAKPLLRQMAPTTFRIQLVNEVARAAQLTATEVEALCELRTAGHEAKAAPRRAAPARPAPPGLDRRLLRLLVNKPAWAEKISAERRQWLNSSPELNPVVELLDILKAGTVSTTAAVIEATRGARFEELYRQAASSALADPVDDSEEPALDQEFVRLELEWIRHECELLESRVPKSDEDKSRLKMLHQRNIELKRSAAVGLQT